MGILPPIFSDSGLVCVYRSSREFPSSPFFFFLVLTKPRPRQVPLSCFVGHIFTWFITVGVSFRYSWFYCRVSDQTFSLAWEPSFVSFLSCVHVRHIKTQYPNYQVQTNALKANNKSSAWLLLGNFDVFLWFLAFMCFLLFTKRRCFKYFSMTFSCCTLIEASLHTLSYSVWRFLTVGNSLFWTHIFIFLMLVYWHEFAAMWALSEPPLFDYCHFLQCELILLNILLKA